MLSRSRRAEYPFFAESGGERDIDRVDVGSCEEFLVTAECGGNLLKRRVRLAVANEFP